LPRGHNPDLYRDGMPALQASALRKAGLIDPSMRSAELELGGVTRRIELWHMRFPSGGSWSYFICPCGRRCQTLRLVKGRFACRLCDKLYWLSHRSDSMGAIERRRELLARPHLNRREKVELALRRAIVLERQRKIAAWRKFKAKKPKR
jgi:hypothetical protein